MAQVWRESDDRQAVGWVVVGLPLVEADNLRHVRELAAGEQV